MTKGGKKDNLEKEDVNNHDFKILTLFFRRDENKKLVCILFFFSRQLYRYSKVVLKVMCLAG